ncbi:unnamed protein product [Adineta steineri]|uniref:AAA+ ATPase domain-containing protein n=2 Tax=Adineta steineri TaxID=433720 RepID=A0A814MB33_9BILA|nr:unnamed protein product [Adineta steineri]
MVDQSNAQILVSSNYSGVSQHVPFSNEDLIKITTQEDINLLHGPTLFSLKYRMLPCRMNRKSYDNYKYSYLHTISSPLDDEQTSTTQGKKAGIYHTTSILRFLVDEYKVDSNTFIYKRTYDYKREIQIMSRIYIDLGNYLSILFENGFRTSKPMNNPNKLKPDEDKQIFYCFSNFEIYHVPQFVERADLLLKQLSQFELYNEEKANLQMVCYSDRLSFYLSSIKMKQPDIVDLKLQYGDEFPNIHKKLLKTLQENKSSGITMLHGSPGTGKTSYLRYLINEVKSKEIIYVPPDLAHRISEPTFLPFLLSHSNSILIIEDAENIIHDRTNNTVLHEQAVANLLNLSDGLLGDAMHQQIICTFNCDIQSIDPALLRDGRLVMEYKFDKLNIENARRLCKHLNMEDYGNTIEKSISLAEIYAKKTTEKEILTMNDDSIAINQRILRDKIPQIENLLNLYS